MTALIVSHLLLLVTIIGAALFADVPKDRTIQQEPIENIEKRYMSSNQIRKKFISQSNKIAELGRKLEAIDNSDSSDLAATQVRIDSVSSDITDLFANTVEIKSTMEKSCGYLDDLMEDETPIADCCINDFTVYCITRTTMLTLDPSFDTTKGSCSTCPDGLESSQ